MACVTIRDAKETDTDIIWRIHTGCIEKVCSSHYSKEEIESWARRWRPDKYVQFIRKEEFILAVHEDNVVGFGHLGACEDHEKFPQGIEAEVKGLYVSPEAAGRGIGKALFEELRRRAVERGSSCLGVCSTLNAVPFYESCGFTVVKEVLHCVGDHSLQCKILEMQLNQPEVLK